MTGKVLLVIHPTTSDAERCRYDLRDEKIDVVYENETE